MLGDMACDYTPPSHGNKSEHKAARGKYSLLLPLALYRLSLFCGYWGETEGFLLQSSAVGEETKRGCCRCIKVSRRASLVPPPLYLPWIIRRAAPWPLSFGNRLHRYPVQDKQATGSTYGLVL